MLFEERDIVTSFEQVCVCRYCNVRCSWLCISLHNYVPVKSMKPISRIKESLFTSGTNKNPPRIFK